MIPFILRFAQRISPINSETLRYDAKRQVAQILENGKWVDKLAKGGQAGENTRLTRVRTETTDDE